MVVLRVLRWCIYLRPGSVIKDMLRVLVFHHKHELPLALLLYCKTKIVPSCLAHS